MAYIPSDICCGCLSRGRKMKTLDGYMFIEEINFIVTEILMETKLSSLTLCWECEAHIQNFIKFKKRMKMCLKELLDYAIAPQNSCLQTTSNLTSTGLDIYDIISETYENDSQDMDPVSALHYVAKEEMDAYSDDDKTLIDIITDEKVELQNQDNILTKEEIDTYSDDDKTLMDIITEEKVQLKNQDNILNKADKVLLKESKKIHKNTKKRLKKRNGVKKKAEEKFVDFEEIVLTREEILAERSDMQSKDEYSNSMFQCGDCILPFANQDDLKEHLQKKHSVTRKYKCEYCARSFPNRSTVERHLRRHSIRWRCTVCRHCSVSVAAAETHYMRMHAQPTGDLHDLAAKAYSTYENKSQDNTEIRPKSSEQIPCPHCGKLYRWKASLRKHIETHSIESGHKRRPHCVTCNLSFATASNLKTHMQGSTKHKIQLKLQKLKQDPTADTEVTQNPDIENIKCTINSQKEQFPCPQCDKKFQWKGNLWRHLQSHAARAKGALVCEPCNRTFSSIATYKQHMEISRKHVTENQYKYMCSDCGKRFYNKIKLREHIDWEHLKKYTHVCSVCQKVFKSHASLYLHRQVVHRLSNATHLCDHCGKSFANKTKLRSHVSGIHMKENPYKCVTCAAQFSWPSCLSRHMKRVHRVK